METPKCDPDPTRFGPILVLSNLFCSLYTISQLKSESVFVFMQPSLVKLRDIYFKNIRGTFNTDSAVSLHCSPSVSCENLQLVDIDLKHITTNNGDPETTSTCLSVKGALQGLQLLHSRF